MQVSHDAQANGDWGIFCPQCRSFNFPTMPIKGNRETIWRLQHMASPELLAVEHQLKQERDMTQALGPVKSQALATYRDRELVITEAIARQIVTTVWPEASHKAPQVVAKAIMICHQYNLNPLLNEVHIIPYGTAYAVVMGIEANRKMAQRMAWYSYEDDTPRMMGEAEEVKFFGKADKGMARAITILRSRDGRRYVGPGQISLSANIQGADKGNSHANMAQIRSERRAMKRLCPDLPDVEVGDENYFPEITVSDGNFDEQAEDLRSLGAEAEAEAADDVVVEAARSWPNDGAFLQDVFNGFGLGRSEVLAILGSKTMPKPEERQAAWFKLKAAHDAKLSAELDAQAATEAAQ